jgi:hypothetical protein
MKIVVPIFMAAGILFLVGCQQSSSSPEPATDTNSTASQMESNAVNTADEMKTNAVMTATNAYMSTTNAMLTNSAPKGP